MPCTKACAPPKGHDSWVLHRLKLSEASSVCEGGGAHLDRVRESHGAAPEARWKRRRQPEPERSRRSNSEPGLRQPGSGEGCMRARVARGEARSAVSCAHKKRSLRACALASQLPDLRSVCLLNDPCALAHFSSLPEGRGGGRRPRQPNWGG
eukprot:264770-Chlamydomonas_euryale.AAC.3